MSSAGSSVMAVREKLREFDRVAASLGIPRRERLAILNTTDTVYVALQDSVPATAGLVTAELERRLSYAMPLMRRLANNTVAAPAAYAMADHRVAAA